jgi:hypothetical protein
MPNLMYCAAQGRVLCFRLSDPLTLYDLTRHDHDIRLLLDASRQRIHTCIDARELRTLPHGLLGLAKSPLLTHPRAGSVAVVGASPLAQTMMTIIAKSAYSAALRHFESETDAWAFLNEQIRGGQSDATSLQAQRAG